MTAALKRLALPQYSLHQNADGSLRLRVAGEALADDALRAALLGVFGPELSLSIEPFDPATAGKLSQYSRDEEE